MGFLWTSRKKNQLNRIYRLKDIQERRFGKESEFGKIPEKEKKIGQRQVALCDSLAGCSLDLSPETRKKVDLVCFGEGRVQNDVEDDEFNHLHKLWL